MASLGKLFWILVLFIPYWAEGRRPFHIPKTLFTPALKNAALPEGAHVIRRAAGKELFKHDEGDDFEGDFVENANPHGGRKRRSIPTQSTSVPRSVNANLNDTHDTLFMYWTPRVQQSNIILLLAKNNDAKKPASSTVYRSDNSGETWTNINEKLQPNALIDQIYISQLEAHLCILTDVANKTIYITTDMAATFTFLSVTWVPSFLLLNPYDAHYVLGMDRPNGRLYFSSDKGNNWVKVSKENVRSFQWGIAGIDTNSKTFYVESRQTKAATTAEVWKYPSSPSSATLLLSGVQEFEVMKNYMFATVMVGGNIKLVVSHNSKPFVDAKFPSTEKFNRDFFVFDVAEDQVFVVINHMKNASHMYVSDQGGVKYYLSIERVLYHNPWTDVSSPWLRALVPYAFVDVHKIKMRGIYVATQLTPGRVGRRHLLNLITYNKGGKWQRIRSPTRDINGNRIFCYLPSCSLHFNLKYGSVYHVSPSEEMLSKDSTPGLVLALGVASTNLKIYPDLFMSTDGGFNWKRVKRGKYQFAVGGRGSVVVAVPYRRSTQTIYYTVDGGETWGSHKFFKSTIRAMDVVTQPGEKLLKFLIYGQQPYTNKWSVFAVDMAPVLARACNPATSDYMNWRPNDGRIGFDKCVLGRHMTYRMRNWTIPCKVPVDFPVPTSAESCPCRRTDFMCDFGYARRAIDQDCSLIPGEDLHKDGLIPSNCPEGSFYNRSRGYRKIPGDSCEGGHESDFRSVKTPCPVQNLQGLVVANDQTDSNQVNLAVGSSVRLTASLVKGYVANVMFRWDFGDKLVTNGTGSNFKSTTHVYTRPGHYVVVVTAHNTKSTLITRVDVFVNDRLDSKKIRIFYTPPDPSIHQVVQFAASITNYSSNAVGSLKYKWTFGDGSKAEGGESSHSFSEEKTYTVQVQINNVISTAIKIISVIVTKDLTPKNAQANTKSSKTVEISWSHPLAADQYFQGYKIYKSMSENSGYSFAALVEKPAQLSEVVADLVPYTKYYFKVAAYSSGALSTFSNVASATTYEGSPSKPQNFRAFPQTAKSVKVQWDAPKFLNGKITKYEVQWWSFLTHAKPETLSPNQTQKTFNNLKENTIYNFQVFAFTSVGKGPQAGPVSVKTDVSKPTMAPRNVMKAGSNGTCVVLQWEPPFMSKTDQRIFPVVKYIVYVDGKDTATTPIPVVIVCSLKPDTAYVFEIKAASVKGLGPMSPKTTYRTSKISPSEPLSFTATSKTPRSVDFTWKRPKVVSGKVLNYVIDQIEPSPNKGPFQVPANASTWQLKGLTPYTKYRFAIAANNMNGMSSWSAEKLVYTLEDIPDKLTQDNVDTSILDPTPATIKLKWRVPRPNGKLTGCKIRWGHVLGHRHGAEFDVLDPGTTEYVFKHLHSNTEYSFAVQCRTKVGPSLGFSEPLKQFTGPAINQTERLKMTFEGKARVRRDDKKMEQFIAEFIKAATKAAKLATDERIAGVDVKGTTVVFDLLPPLKDGDVSTKDAKDRMDGGFAVGSSKVVPKSLVVVHVYIMHDGMEVTVKPAGPGVVGAQTDTQSVSTNTLALAIVIPIIIIGLALLAGLVFYYRKYKNLENNYGRVTGEFHSGNHSQMMNMVYDGGMGTETNEEVYEDDSPKKRRYKDEQKLPLGEHDELAMI